MTAPRIGFIGIGAMGWPMAGLLASKIPLCVYDIVAARAASFVAENGGTIAETLADLAAQSDMIVTMLPTSNDVEKVLKGDDGLLAHCRKGTLFVEMSSGAQQQTEALGRLVAAGGSAMIDAPVSGGVARAKTGELSIMVGGAEADIEKARPVLETLGTTILATGPLGSAHAMKALNNLVSACTLVATLEALKIGQKSGLDPARMVDILNVSTGMSNSSQKKMHQFVLSHRFNSGFGLDLMVKDLKNAIALADEAGLGAPLSKLCVDICDEARGVLGPGQDHTAVAKVVADTL